MLAVLIGCGLRRGELLALQLGAIQQREEHGWSPTWSARPAMSEPSRSPRWVKSAVDAWTAAAAITQGPVFRAINKTGRVRGDGMSPKVLWDTVQVAAARSGAGKLGTP
jgi:integrase